MSFLYNLLLSVQILSALAMIGLVLIQHGKGADVGAAFGSGSSDSLFGASGGSNFLSRSTALLATVFFLCTLALTYLSSVGTQTSGNSSVLERTPPASVPAEADSNKAVAPQPPAAASGTAPAAVPPKPLSGGEKIPN